MKPVLIWGAGAIGGALGAAFLRAGREVVFVDRDADHVAAINAGGLRIEGPIRSDTVRAPAFSPEAATGVFDVAFLCVKAHHTEAAARALAPHVAADGVIVSAQNGLNEREIARIAGPARTMGCFVNFGADYLSPGVVHYSGRGAVVVGELDGAMTPRVRDIHALLTSFDERAVLTANIWGFLWGKMIYGALLFGTALTNDAIADVLEDARWRPTLAALGREVGAVAAAEGIATEGFDGFDPGAFAPGAAQALIDRSFADMVAHNRRSAKSHSGIWRDLAVRRRPTEVDAQLGPVAAIGAAHGAPVPITTRLIAMIHEIEAGTRPLAIGNLAELGGAVA